MGIGGFFQNKQYFGGEGLSVFSLCETGLILIVRI